MWTRIRRFFKSSEVIFLARLQLMGGVILSALIEADPNILSGFIPTKWFGIYLVVAGIVIEIARRMRDEEMAKRK